MITRIRILGACWAVGLALVWLAPDSVTGAEGEGRGAEAVRLDAGAARSLPTVTMASNPCNPCAVGNACNPCAAKNPCNPCGVKANPCGANPCNPCAAGGRVDASRFVLPEGEALASGSRPQLVARGEELWKDGSLSSNGASCSTCHIGGYAQMQPSFATPYPHRVTMVEQMSGVSQVGAAEMVQFCMLQPMQAEPLPWGSPKLAALAAYVEHIQPGYTPAAGGITNPCNPCASRNPCAPRNACNPCGGG